jgi:exosortase
MNQQKPNNSISTNLPALLLLALLFATFILAYFPVWKRLVLTWYRSDDYSHGFFIIPLCFYIIWRKKEILAEIPIKPSLWGLALAIFSLLLYLFAHFAEIMTLTSFSMVLLLAGMVIYFYGFLMVKELLFPLFLLLFMIPVPAQIYAKLTIPLQLFVSKVSVGISSLLGLPIYREGNVIHLHDRTLQVVQACSGLRSMISLLTLCAIFSYFTLKSNLLRSILFLSGIPAAILVNIIRVLLLVFAFHYFNYDLTTGTTHTLFGMIIFILALIFIFVMKRVLSTWDKSAT